jgi:two-component system, response regulator PdtaR
VIDADNGDDAILLAREHRPELALLDIRMEGKSGFDVAEPTCATPTASPSCSCRPFRRRDHARAEVQALGAVAYLVKPLDVGQIVPAVDAVMARVRGGGRRLPARRRRRRSRRAAAPPSRRCPRAAARGRRPPCSLAVGVLMHRYSLRARGLAAAAAPGRRAGAGACRCRPSAWSAAVEELARSAEVPARRRRAASLQSRSVK